jgi:hypothetical protein
MKLVYRRNADSDETEEAFDDEHSALHRACELIAEDVYDIDLIYDDDRTVDIAALRAYCTARSGGGGGGGRRGPSQQTIRITAAVFNERGQRFAVVQATTAALANRAQADQAWRTARQLLGVPVVLTDGRRLHGDPGLVRSFQSVDLSRISGWQQFTFTV